MITIGKDIEIHPTIMDNAKLFCLFGTQLQVEARVG